MICVWVHVLSTMAAVDHALYCLPHTISLLETLMTKAVMRYMLKWNGSHSKGSKGCVIIEVLKDGTFRFSTSSIKVGRVFYYSSFLMENECSPWDVLLRIKNKLINVTSDKWMMDRCVVAIEKCVWRRISLFTMSLLQGHETIGRWYFRLSLCSEEIQRKEGLDAYIKEERLPWNIAFQRRTRIRVGPGKKREMKVHRIISSFRFI